LPVAVELPAEPEVEPPDKDGAEPLRVPAEEHKVQAASGAQVDSAVLVLAVQADFYKEAPGRIVQA
jgi:hypothetical protein